MKVGAGLGHSISSCWLSFSVVAEAEGSMAPNSKLMTLCGNVNLLIARAQPRLARDSKGAHMPPQELMILRQLSSYFNTYFIFA